MPPVRVQLASIRATRASDWGSVPIRIVPRDAYDGILLVRDATPPHYVVW